MAETKITMKDYFNAAIVNFGGEVDGEIMNISNEDMIKFFRGRIAQIEKKSSSKKSEKAEAEVEKLKNHIFEVMSTMEPSTATTIMKADAELAELTIQKITAMLKKLEADGRVEKTKDKKSTLYAAIITESVE